MRTGAIKVQQIATPRRAMTVQLTVIIPHNSAPDDCTVEWGRSWRKVMNVKHTGYIVVQQESFVSRLYWIERHDVHNLNKTSCARSAKEIIVNRGALARGRRAVIFSIFQLAVDRHADYRQWAAGRTRRRCGTSRVKWRKGEAASDSINSQGSRPYLVAFTKVYDDPGRGLETFVSKFLVEQMRSISRK